MADVIEYPEALKEEHGGMVSGRLKLTGNQIIFKNSKTGKIDNISSGELKSIHWQRMAAQYALRILAKGGQIYRYGGLRETEKEKLERYVNKNYPIEMDVQEFSHRGWNWGTASFDGSVLNFDIKKNEKAFEIPLSNVSHCTTAKNEVTLEFHQNDDVPVSLMEVRFHIPTIDGNDASQMFMEEVLSKASIIRETGECIAIFKELQCLTPRGRYDIKIYPTYIQLHGKTFDYKIPTTSVLRLFQLPHKDSRQIFFVTSMDPPIKQGQTRYHFLILLFSKEEDSTTIELGLSDKELNEKFDGKLSKRMSGQTYEILSKVMRALIGRKVIMPDSSFSKDNPAITCSYKASNGMLYPLERGFIYLHKPPLHVRFDEINCVNFARSGGGTRSFDFEIETKSGITHSFSSIDKDEYAKLFDFVAAKKIRLKNIKTGTGGAAKDDDLIDSDLDDDDQDAYMHRVKEEGRIREEIDDSDESDDDFNPDGEVEDVREEFDSDASSSSEEDSDASGDDNHKHKKKHHHKEKKEKISKKKKKKDGDDKPKRPQSAYFLWMNAERANIKKDNPGLSVAEIAKKAGELWKTLSESDKAKWNDLAAQQKEEFKRSGGGGGGSSEKKVSSPKKSPSKSGGGGGSQFKSKEYIESSDDSNDSDDSKKKRKKKPAKETKEKKKAKKEESSSEEEEEEDDDDEEEEMSTGSESD